MRSVRAAIITVSTRGAAGERADESGPAMRDALAALVKAVTPDTVFVMLERMEIDTPEVWLG